MAAVSNHLTSVLFSTVKRSKTWTKTKEVLPKHGLSARKASMFSLCISGIPRVGPSAVKSS